MSRTTEKFTKLLGRCRKETQHFWERRHSDAATSEQTRVAAPATDSDLDATTSGPIWTAAAATAGHTDAATLYENHTPGNWDRLNVQDRPSRAPSTRHRDVRDLSAGQAAMGGGGGTRTRFPMLSPRVTGDRQPSDPSRRTRNQEAR